MAVKIFHTVSDVIADLEEKYIETMRGNYPANIRFFGINIASS